MSVTMIRRPCRWARCCSRSSWRARRARSNTAASMRRPASLPSPIAEMGVNLDGSFARYSAKLAFDPAKPQAARVAIDVQMASIDAGAEEATSEVAGAAWFDTVRHPLAKFESTGMKLLAPGRYQLSGNLTIKGRTHAISRARELPGAGRARRAQRRVSSSTAATTAWARGSGPTPASSPMQCGCAST